MNRVHLTFVLMVSLVVFGCNRQAANPTDGANDKLTVCMLPKIKGISYFTSCYQGAQEAAAELGNIDLIYDGPIDGDPKKQAELIEQWIVDGVDVICVAPNAPDVVAKPPIPAACCWDIAACCRGMATPRRRGVP